MNNITKDNNITVNTDHKNFKESLFFNIPFTKKKYKTRIIELDIKKNIGLIEIVPNFSDYIIINPFKKITTLLPKF